LGAPRAFLAWWPVRRSAIMVRHQVSRCLSSQTPASPRLHTAARQQGLLQHPACNAMHWLTPVWLRVSKMVIAWLFARIFARLFLTRCREWSGWRPAGFVQAIILPVNGLYGNGPPYAVLRIVGPDRTVASRSSLSMALSKNRGPAPWRSGRRQPEASSIAAKKSH